MVTLVTLVLVYKLLASLFSALQTQANHRTALAKREAASEEKDKVRHAP